MSKEARKRAVERMEKSAELYPAEPVAQRKDSRGLRLASNDGRRVDDLLGGLGSMDDLGSTRIR